MIRLYVKKWLFSYERIVFACEIAKSKADIIRYMRYRDKELLGDKSYEEYITLITDLTVPHEEIFGQYNSKLRNQVRRAYRENITYIIHDRLDIIEDRDLLIDVRDKYYHFCDIIQAEVLKHNLIWTEFLKYVENGNVMISKAEYENGWVYHVYQTDHTTAMLWFSFSDYRNESCNKQLAGWANRALHDQDIMFFQKQGYKEYDWGNISSLTNPNDIDKFKMSFGGRVVSVYSCFVANSIKGNILIKFRKVERELLLKN